MKRDIITQSKWKKDLKHEYHDNGSDTLIVLLPGAGYTVEGPLFYYLIGLSLKLGYDVLAINYGYQLSQNQISIRDELENLEGEIKDTLSKVKSYKKTVYMAKSLGTYFLDDLRGNDPCVYFTPVDWTMPQNIKPNTYFVYGDRDRHLSDDNKTRIYNLSYIVEGANHGLVCDNVFDSIEKMGKIIENVESFLVNR